TLVTLGCSKINGSAAEHSGKARERLQGLLRIRPCPSARRITAEGQSQHGQAPLHICRYSSPDGWIRHDTILHFVSFVVFSRLSNGVGARRMANNVRQPAVKVITLLASAHPLSAGPVGDSETRVMT